MEPHMQRPRFCTWAPSVFAGQRMLQGTDTGAARQHGPVGTMLDQHFTQHCQWLEAIGISHVLIAQRWWGSAQEMEGSSLDCLAVTSHLAARTQRLGLITAIHPGFFLPSAIAKWGATLSRLAHERWAINVTSGWHVREFEMYGVSALEHDERYRRTAEFIDVLRGAWQNEEFSYTGQYFSVNGLRLEPRPLGPLTIYQGGQSDAAIALAAGRSDWMFLNGGPPEKIAAIIARVRAACARTGRNVRFALYAIPLCRDSDRAAHAEIDARIQQMDPSRIEARRAAVSGASGMWANADRLSLLDSNEGYASGLIGSADTIAARMREFLALGVDMFHLGLQDQRFVDEVLPRFTQA